MWVRTFPLTLLHDHTLATHTHDWDQLTYATAGVLRVATADASWVVPPHRASRRTIERLFAQETGMTVAEWRRRRHLLHAVRLLAEGEPVFKKAFGATPGRYAAS